MAEPRPVTLGNLVREDKLLGVYCRDCCHERDVNPATVPLPAETPVPEVGKKMKCSKGGSRAVETKPDRRHLGNASATAIAQNRRD